MANRQTLERKALEASRDASYMEQIKQAALELQRRYDLSTRLDDYLMEAAAIR